MSEEEAYKIFSEMTPDVLDYVFCLAKAYTEKDREIERLNNIINEIRNAFNDKTILNNMMLVRRIKEIIGGNKE